MTSTYETGHANNVAIAEKSVDLFTSMGESFAPPLLSLTLPELNLVVPAARDALEAVSSAETQYRLAVNAKKTMEGRISPLVKSAWYLVSLVAPDKAFMDDVDPVVRAIIGSSKVSRQSLESKLSNAEIFVDRISRVPDYAPTNEDITVTGLTQLVTDCRASQREVNTKVLTLQDARSHRDRLLYHPQDGLVARIRAIKVYFKGQFGPKSEYYQKLVGYSRQMTMKKINV